MNAAEAMRAADNTLALDDLRGGTFTIERIGSFPADAKIIQLDMDATLIRQNRQSDGCR